jgi:hypothetical protein
LSFLYSSWLLQAPTSAFYGVVGGLFAVCAFETDWALKNVTLMEVHQVKP